MLTPLQQSILETVVYFDLFDYPLTLSELYRYLWRAPDQVSLTDVEAAVQQLPQLQTIDGVIVLTGRESLSRLREERYIESERKFRRRRIYLWLLTCLPGVEAIWIVNTLAYHNVRRTSDIDLLIVAQPGKIWSTRFFTTALAKILRLRPTVQHTQDTLCLSFYLTSATLDLSMLTHNNFERYEAYWLAAIMPVYDPKQLLPKCWQQNTWAQRVLPYAEPMALHYNRSIKDGWNQHLGHALGRLFLWEKLWKKIQLRMLPHRLKQLSGPVESAIVVLTDQLLKFHTIDPRPTLMERFQKHLNDDLRV